ncbi:MAG: PIN domain-containing protein [Candidatus Hodarchaeales archaeon]
MDVVWDTGALSLYFADHPEVKEYMRQIIKAKRRGYIPRLILAEFFYKTTQKFGKQVAQIRLVALRQIPIIEEPMTEVDVLGIGLLKVKHRRLSLADCVIVHLAEKRRAMILTTEEEITKLKGVKAKKILF